MKNKTIVALLLAVIQVIFASEVSLAAAIQFTPGPEKGVGKLSGEIPVRNAGAVHIPQGIASLNGDTLELTAIPDGLFDRRVVLAGRILKTRLATRGRQAIFAGLVYFNEGAMLPDIDTSSEDVITVIGAGPKRGRINAVTGDSIDFSESGGQRAAIPLGDIEDIVSSRAFTFQVASTAPSGAPNAVQAATARSFLLRPTSRAGRVAMKSVSSTVSLDAEDSSELKWILLGSTMSILNTAGILAPAIAVPIGMRNQAKRVTAEDNLFNFLSDQNSQQ